MHQTNLAYVAGLIDGEGCIHLDVSKTTYRARVSVGMTAPALPLLTSLKEEWGGTLYQMRKPTKTWAGAWTWHLTGPPAAKLLKMVQPYLRLKAGQADAALLVEEIRDGLAPLKNNQKRWTPEARAECAAIKIRLHEMNQKGPRPSAAIVEEN